MIILGTNSIKDTGYNVANSVRFNDGDSAYMHKTPGGDGNQRTFTFSCWIKLGDLSGAHRTIFSVGADNNNTIRMLVRSNDKFQAYCAISGSDVIDYQTNRLLRDVSAWMHLCLAVDTTQGTAGDRVKIYINGTQETSFSTTDQPDQNTDLPFSTNQMEIGRRHDNTSQFFDGYMAEVVFIDGLALAPTSFGEFDEDSPTIWKPKDVSGLTFGTNGFYLDFEDSSALGNDVAGSNNFTVNNLTAIDQSTDTCTNNSCVINSLDNYFYSATLSEGNLKQTANSGNYSFGTSTFGVSQGKWVVEVKIESGSTVRNVVGITDKVSTGTTNELGSLANGWQYAAAGSVYNNGSDIGGSYDSYTTNDIIGIYLDLDNNKLYFSKNGTVQNSGTGISITAPSSTTNGVYFFAFGDYGASDDSVNNVNFGSPAFSISSGNTDGEYGNFEYTTTITGDSASKTFKALNTKNLAEFG